MCCEVFRWICKRSVGVQEEQVRASAAEHEKRLRRIEEDAAASERRAAIIHSDAETQANRIVSSFLRWYPHMEAACGDGPSLISCIVEYRLLLGTCHMRKSWPVRKG
jgi:hypothetical protein